MREGTQDDAEACAAIYEHYVRSTPITFEIEPLTAVQMAERIVTALQSHAWYVLESDGAVVGYSYATAYAARAAYQWSCETSVYLHKDFRGRGGGRQLYAVLLERLAARGYRQAVAGITLPNDASRRLHETFGFKEVGTFKDIGWKLGAWHDVLRLQRPLADSFGAPDSLTYCGGERSGSQRGSCSVASDEVISVTPMAAKSAMRSGDVSETASVTSTVR